MMETVSMEAVTTTLFDRNDNAFQMAYAVGSSLPHAFAFALPPSDPTTSEVVPDRIFIAGIPATMGSNELSALFENYGCVKSSKIIFASNGLSKGYGFVTFATPQEADAVLKMASTEEGLRKLEMCCGKRVVVSHAVRRLCFSPTKYKDFFGYVSVMPDRTAAISGFHDGILRVRKAHSFAELSSLILEGSVHQVNGSMFSQQPPSAFSRGAFGDAQSADAPRGPQYGQPTFLSPFGRAPTIDLARQSFVAVAPPVPRLDARNFAVAQQPASVQPCFDGSFTPNFGRWLPREQEGQKMLAAACHGKPEASERCVQNQTFFEQNVVSREARGLAHAQPRRMGPPRVPSGDSGLGNSAGSGDHGFQSRGGAMTANGGFKSYGYGPTQHLQSFAVPPMMSRGDGAFGSDSLRGENAAAFAAAGEAANAATSGAGDASHGGFVEPSPNKTGFVQRYASFIQPPPSETKSLPSKSISQTCQSVRRSSTRSSVSLINQFNKAATAPHN